MIKSMSRSASGLAGAALALSFGLALAGCGAMPSNRSLNSLHEPVVERVNFTLDVATGPDGLSYAEERRLAAWFDTLKLRYGDRIALDDPMASEATQAAVAAIASRHGLIVSGDAPVTAGAVSPGSARIVITRTKASVPGCPDWSAKLDVNLGNGLSSNYGCAVNSNLAAMVANPEDLIKGAESDSDTVVMSSTKAIESYRKAAPTGNGNVVKQQSSTGN
jgi:pilus assembly protein CpaD